MRTLPLVALALLYFESGILAAQETVSPFAGMDGTWDVEQRMWAAPNAAPVALPAAIAERQLVMGTYLEETMRLAHEPADATQAFSRNAFLNYNVVTKKYEYTSLDTRAPQLMVEHSAPLPNRKLSEEMSLDGGTFLAPQWGDAKNVTFTYRLTIGAVKDGKQTVRLFLTPQSILPKVEFKAFEYVYTKRQ